MLPIIMNTNFEKLAVIDDYSSFIWTTRYYDVGDFELCVDVTINNINLLQIGYYIMRDDDDNLGIIEKINISQNSDGKERLIVSGRFLASVIGRRIISKQTQVSGTVSKAIETLLDNEVINPTDSSRQISGLNYISSVVSTDTFQAQYTGKNLLTVIEDLCLTYGLGFKVILQENNEFTFKLYEGVDRSYNQNINPYIVFSDKYDNLISSQYEESHQNLVNAVLVAGEGEGIDRKMIWALNGSPSGLDRYEYFADKRDIQSNEGEISEEDYYEQLQNSGNEYLTEFTSAFTGDVYFDNIKYREDVNVGDICTIENEKWGIYINSRLVEVIESVNESGAYSIVPTFGV